jgi:hypothetical protein
MSSVTSALSIIHPFVSFIMTWLIWFGILIGFLLITYRLWQRYERSRIWRMIARSPSVGITNIDDGIIRRRVWRVVAGSIANLQWIEAKLPRVPPLPPSPIIAEQWGLAEDCTCAALVTSTSISISLPFRDFVYVFTAYELDHE